MMLISEEKSCFAQAWRRLSEQTETQTTQVLSTLETLYSAQGRHYHNLDHVLDCMEQLRQMQKDLNSPLSVSDMDSVSVCIWFHDAFYDPKSHTNEEDSARLFMELSTGMAMEVREKIDAMILATKTHQVPSVSASSDLFKVMLDIDLSILGRSEDQFDLYDEAIRKEYDWVPEAIYCAKRGHILEEFLKRDQIYKTMYFHSKYEATSRYNLRRAIDRLQVR